MWTKGCEGESKSDGRISGTGNLLPESSYVSQSDSLAMGEAERIDAGAMTWVTTGARVVCGTGAEVKTADVSSQEVVDGAT